MMNSFNCVGNLVGDPVFYDGETPRVVFRLAIDHNGKPVEGRKNAEFLDFVAWRNVAKYIAEYAHKGDRIEIHNAMAKNHEYTNANGDKVSREEFEVENVCIGNRVKTKE